MFKYRLKEEEGYIIVASTFSKIDLYYILDINTYIFMNRLSK